MCCGRGRTGAPPPTFVASRDDGTARDLVAARAPALPVGGLILRVPLGARPCSRPHGGDGDHGLGRHDPVLTVAEVNAPEAASLTSPRPHRAPEHDDELRHRVAAGDVEQPGPDGDPVAKGRRRRSHGVGVHVRVPFRFRGHDVLGTKHATESRRTFSREFRIRRPSTLQDEQVQQCRVRAARARRRAASDLQRMRRACIEEDRGRREHHVRRDTLIMSAACVLLGSSPIALRQTFTLQSSVFATRLRPETQGST
jgi:hypothetical protein